VIATDQQIRAAITERAAQWFMAHRAGALDESERAAFLAWLKTSPVHVEEYLGVTALERSMAAAAGGLDMELASLLERARQSTSTPLVAPSMDSGSSPHELASSVRPERSGRRRWLGIVVLACLGVAVISTLWLLRNRDLLNLPKTYETARGAQEVLRLADGSVLHLDTATAVTVRFSSTERLLTLKYGQALFEVAHDSRRPFHVVSGTANTIAVGTEFDVYRRADTTLITVLQGQVTVSTAGSAFSNLAGHAQTVHVGAGQQLRLSAGAPPGVAQPVDLDQALAWLRRHIAFDRRPLAEVADEFNRYNQIPFTIDDPALRMLPISGMFDAYDQDSFATFLASLEGVGVERLPTQIRVSRVRRSSPGPRPTGR
jgi:transmembrane sensor